MDWKDIAGPLLRLGLPVLGSAIVPGLGTEMGAAAGKMISDALGVDNTPEAVNDAVQSQSPAEVQRKLQDAEADAAAKWPALAQIALAHADVAKAQIAATADRMRDELAAGEQLPPGFWRTLVLVLNSSWRPIYAFEGLIECAALSILLGRILERAFFADGGGTDIDMLLRLIPLITVLVVPYMGCRFGILGYYMKMRTVEKTSAMEQASSSNLPGIDVNALVNGLIKAVAKR